MFLLNIMSVIECTTNTGDPFATKQRRSLTTNENRELNLILLLPTDFKGIVHATGRNVFLMVDGR